MKLTPVDPHILPIALATIAARLELDSAPALALNRIAATAKNPIVCSEVSTHRRGALELVRLAGLPAINEAPSSAFSWDGAAVRTDSEASVLIHEVAHWLIAPPARRALPDFGLGAGPETGCAALADAACCVDNATKEEEELLASLLGILFEAALGQPAISAFIEQNWLEAWDRPVAARQFRVTVEKLLKRGLIDDSALPVLLQDGSTATADISMRNSGQASALTSTIADAGPSLGK
ncbi:MAG: hypothetical protein VX700_08005 [Pseudomonadota bacterium]|nr:hypothetical protein [Pseudomonadota bacterium]